MTAAHWISLGGFVLALLVQTIALIRWFTRREVEVERSRAAERDAWRLELHGLETRMRMDTASAKSEGADAQRKVIELELRMERGPLGEEAAREALLEWWASEDVRALAEEYQAQQARWEAKVAEKKARKAAAKAAREAQD